MGDRGTFIQLADEVELQLPAGLGEGQVTRSGKVTYDPWLYVPILQRKPGALRNGAPFKGWQLPGALGRMRTRLTGRDAWCLARSIYVASDKIMERLVRGARHDFLEGLP